MGKEKYLDRDFEPLRVEKKRGMCYNESANLGLKTERREGAYEYHSKMSDLRDRI